MVIYSGEVLFDVAKVCLVFLKSERKVLVDNETARKEAKSSEREGHCGGERERY